MQEKCRAFTYFYMNMSKCKENIADSLISLKSIKKDILLTIIYENAKSFRNISFLHISL